MRVVALEEHFSAPALAARIDKGAISRRGFRHRSSRPRRVSRLDLDELLIDVVRQPLIGLGRERLSHNAAQQWKTRENRFPHTHMIVPHAAPPAPILG